MRKKSSILGVTDLSHLLCCWMWHLEDNLLSLCAISHISHLPCGFNSCHYVERYPAHGHKKVFFYDYSHSNLDNKSNKKKKNGQF
ncbi:hypothetical protein FKM82_010308 [Ascaphus truei]